MTLRLALLQVFGALCQLQRELISILLCSVLPIELARDILDTLKDGGSGGEKGTTMCTHSLAFIDCRLISKSF